MTAPAVIYLGEPDIPAGMTIDEYRRTRSARAPWWLRVPGRRQPARS
jgi:hypothetical protein